MSFIPYTAKSFPANVPPTGDIGASLAQVMWAAATVGVSPVVATVGNRSLLELCWRMTMVVASLKVSDDRWEKSRAYSRLDASEKSAVSYFLGMTLAQLACAQVLGVPSLVHLDAVLAALGKPVPRRRRPDFLGVHPTTAALSIAVEAKGRTHGRDGQAMTKAKLQAQSLPEITGVSASMAVAAMSHFSSEVLDRRVTWRCDLDDPPRPDGPDDKRPITREAILALHFIPITSAVLGARFDREGPFTRASLPNLDAWLWAPTALVEATADTRITSGPRKLKEIGSRLQDIIASTTSGDFQPTDFTTGFSSAARFFMGDNAIGIELGPTWTVRS